MRNGENILEVLLYLYKQCKHHTKHVFYVYKWIHFGNMSYNMYVKFDKFSTWNVDDSKLIKKICLKSDQHPPLI